MASYKGGPRAASCKGEGGRAASCKGGAQGRFV